MGRFVVDLEDDGIELDAVDIGVSDGVIAFELSGRIRGMENDILEEIADKDLVPTEIQFERQSDD